MVAYVLAVSFRILNSQPVVRLNAQNKPFPRMRPVSVLLVNVLLYVLLFIFVLDTLIVSNVIS